jgi:hypothetical protein
LRICVQPRRDEKIARSRRSDIGQPDCLCPVAPQFLIRSFEELGQAQRFLMIAQRTLQTIDNPFGTRLSPMS